MATSQGPTSIERVGKGTLRVGDKLIGVGALPPAVQAAIELRKIQGEVARQIMASTWGANIDQNTGRAIAAWGNRHNVDVVTEVYLLGGRIYLNANFYLRKLGELIEKGVVIAAWPDFIHEDSRMDNDERWAAEKQRLRDERILHRVPESAIAACAFHVRVVSQMARLIEAAGAIQSPGTRILAGDGWVEFTGVKWIDPKRKDPVGIDQPILTVESRAARRVMRILATHVKEARHIEDIVESADALAPTIAALRPAEVKAVTGGYPTPIPEGEYGRETIQPVERREVRVDENDPMQSPPALPPAAVQDFAVPAREAEPARPQMPSSDTSAPASAASAEPATAASTSSTPTESARSSTTRESSPSTRNTTDRPRKVNSGPAADDDDYWDRLASEQ